LTDAPPPVGPGGSNAACCGPFGHHFRPRVRGLGLPQASSCKLGLGPCHALLGLGPCRVTRFIGTSSPPPPSPPLPSPPPSPPPPSPPPAPSPPSLPPEGGVSTAPVRAPCANGLAGREAFGQRAAHDARTRSAASAPRGPLPRPPPPPYPPPPPSPPPAPLPPPYASSSSSRGLKRHKAPSGGGVAEHSAGPVCRAPSPSPMGGTCGDRANLEAHAGYRLSG
jgi:hypothetical protein